MLADYVAPSMPAEQTFLSAWRRLQHRISGQDDSPLLSDAGLERASSKLVDDLADPPGCAPVLQALEKTMGDWARSPENSPRMQLIVVPPGDRTGAIETWARSAGHTLFVARPRAELTGPSTELAARDLAGDGLLVIPRLEHWFLRQRNGLRAVRSLLTQLSASNRRCLVACDSWAWAYLAKAASAELYLPRPRTCQAFNAVQLRQWFADLAVSDPDHDSVTFRLARNGDDVLACNDDGEPSSDWLRLLAARSGGIPWVAWQLWRSSMQLQTEGVNLSERAERATINDKRTVWITDMKEPRMPATHEDRALLVLHALLIHGALSASELETVLPATGDADVVPALVESGHLRCDRGNYSVRPTAYPAVRQALQAADFPVGAM